MELDAYHQLLHWVADSVGHHISEQTPPWLHPVLHVVLVWGPAALLLLAGLRGIAAVRRRLAQRRLEADPAPAVPGFERSVHGYVIRHTRRHQFALVGMGLLTMPVLYVTLELPKLIINNALDEASPSTLSTPIFGALTQSTFLFLLSGLYLLAIMLNGSLKYALNVYKGRVGERLLRRLRLCVYRRWRKGAGDGRRSEIIPLIAQEVEPVGGFAADAFALPVFQGGTFITILVFMFAQDVVLGAAALTLLPVQIALVPRLQRKLNEVARARVREVRRLGGELGAQSSDQPRSPSDVRIVAKFLKRIEELRFEAQRRKYMIKGINNFWRCP